MDTMTDNEGSLSPEECLQKLAAAHLGRLAFSDRALPALVPMNYIVDGRDLVLDAAATAPVVRAAQGRGSIVAFEVDEIDPETNSGWCVSVTGRLHQIADRRRVERYARNPTFPGEIRARHFLVITPGLVSGRWFPRSLSRSVTVSE
jgi:uncharacterized protein